MAAIVLTAATPLLDLLDDVPGPRVLPVAVNARVLATGEGGVRRVAAELLRALDHLLPERGYAPLPRLSPAGGTPQLWEQAALPLAARGRLILGLGNQGPVLARNAITMIHDAQVFISPASYSAGFRRWYMASLPLIGRRHRRILTVSRFAAAELARHGVASTGRITVVPNGVDHILRPAPDRSIFDRLGVAPGSYACALANSQAHKNVGLLLRAFARPELAHLHLVLTGAARAEAFAAPVPANVIFAGAVSDAELRALLGAALCQLCPSTTEGFGLPPLEAMRLGTPAIIAPLGALPETCGTAAIRAPADDPAAWAAAILRLAADPDEARARGAAGRDHARAFTWHRAAEAVLAILEAECPDPAR
ncbi:MAG: glycosyltransferase family 1 protein [Amaricoccus sp.]|uniref:glycosyltransferase family 4 protein n=1 Tax=Amaricoccus sp. TaxID=1872485 RepID=UPI0039E63046